MLTDIFHASHRRRVIAASIKLLGMNDKTSQPILPVDLVDMPKLQKLICFHKAGALMVVNLFVVDEQRVNRLITQVCFECFIKYLIFDLYLIVIIT